MPKKPRALTATEQELWNKVIKQVETINDMPAAQIQAAIKPVKTPQVPNPAPIKPFRIGQKQTTPKPPQNAAPSFVDRPTQTSPNMDRKNFQRLLKGKLEIDATLDLHGMTSEQARTHLMFFVKNAHRAGNRLLLIITGKGNKHTIDEFGRPRSGIIKSGVPEWLKTGALSGLVLQVTQAHGKHGGGGAYYVYLRRNR